jgi:hypothetical protein
MAFLRNLPVYSDTQYTRRFLPTRGTGQVRFIIFIFYILKIYRNDDDVLFNLPNTCGGDADHGGGGISITSMINKPAMR